MVNNFKMCMLELAVNTHTHTMLLHVFLFALTEDVLVIQFCAALYHLHSTDVTQVQGSSTEFHFGSSASSHFVPVTIQNNPNQESQCLLGIPSLVFLLG